MHLTYPPLTDYYSQSQINNMLTSLSGGIVLYIDQQDTADRAYTDQRDLTTSGSIIAYINTVSGDLTSYVNSQYTNLYNQIVSTSGSIINYVDQRDNYVLGQITTTSGDIVNWISNQAYVNLSKLTTTSGDLKDYIDARDAVISGTWASSTIPTMSGVYQPFWQYNTGTTAIMIFNDILASGVSNITFSIPPNSTSPYTLGFLPYQARVNSFTITATSGTGEVAGEDAFQTRVGDTTVTASDMIPDTAFYNVNTSLLTAGRVITAFGVACDRPQWVKFKLAKKHPGEVGWFGPTYDIYAPVGSGYHTGNSQIQWFPLTSTVLVPNDGSLYSPVITFSGTNANAFISSADSGNYYIAVIAGDNVGDGKAPGMNSGKFSSFGVRYSGSHTIGNRTSASGYVQAFVPPVSGTLSSITYGPLVGSPARYPELLLYTNSITSSGVSSGFTVSVSYTPSTYFDIQGSMVTRSGNIWTVDGSSLVNLINTTSGTLKQYIDSKADTTSISGTGGITATQSGSVWYINGSGVTGTGTATTSGAVVLTGAGVFTNSGTASVTHNLNSLSHYTSITLMGSGAYNADQVSKVGTIYVQTGLNQDNIYANGETYASGIGFNWFISTSGSVAVAGNSSPTGSVTAQPLDYEPPAMQYYSASQLLLRKGRYFCGGARWRGQFQDSTNITNYWDLSSNTTATVSGVYSAGSQAGCLGTFIQVNSWYSVFQVGSDSNSILLLPFVRARAVTYSGGTGQTYISLNDHFTGTTASGKYIGQDDAWNNYRLLKLSYDSNDGNLYNIVDSVAGTGVNGNLMITGDQTTTMSGGDWLQLIPPSSQASLYLGTISTDSAASIRSFTKNKFKYQYTASIVTGLTPTLPSSPINKDISTTVPPTAINLRAYIDMMYNTGGWDHFYIYSGNSGANLAVHMGESGNWMYGSFPFSVDLTAVSLIRYALKADVGGSEYTSFSWANLYTTGFEE